VHVSKINYLFRRGTGGHRKAVERMPAPQIEGERKKGTRSLEKPPTNPNFKGREKLRASRCVWVKVGTMRGLIHNGVKV
jgi:hypothetical protein